MEVTKMKERTLEEVRKVWERYTPLRVVDPFFLKVDRIGVTNLERRIDLAIAGTDNQLRKMVTDRDEIMGVEHTYQGTDVADFFWNLHNWNYFQRQGEEKKTHLYRLAVVAGYFMEAEKMHPEMRNAVNYAERFL